MIYKGESAIELSGGDLRTVVLPERGAKIASVYNSRWNRELLWQHSGDYTRPGDFGGSFRGEDSSGFDDMFPNIDAGSCKIEGAGRTELPDHGELWSEKWSLLSYDEGKCVLSVESKLLPCRLVKQITAGENSLEISYSLENLSTRDIPCLWAAHALFSFRSGMVLRLPGCRAVNAFRDEQEAGYGESLVIAGGREILQEDSGRMRKYYLDGKVESGICHLDDDEAGARVTVEWNPDECPYLGIWINEGGWSGQNNIGIEPSLAAMDRPDRAEEYGMQFRLEGGMTHRWRICIRCAEKE